MSEFFSICDYFNITPCEFFDSNRNNPALISKVVDELKGLSDDDILLILTFINRLHKKF